jgi:hypothetical protein
MSDTPPSEVPSDPPSPPDDLAPASPTPSEEKQGFVEWLWRSRALQDATSGRGAFPPQQRDDLRRARAALELAERALDPVDPLRHGSSIPFSLTLFQEAAFWALRARLESPDLASLSEAFERSDPGLLEAAVPSQENLVSLRHALCERDFVATAAVPLAQLEAEARLASLFVRALLSSLDAPERAAHHALLQRWTRVLGLLCCLLAIAAGASFGASKLSRGPNLAAGKPWKTSSTGITCYPKIHQCGAAHTDILFHTQEEENPWFEIDLQRPTTFSRVEVYNRSDCCPDRAVPLVIEVSSDHQRWKEIARRSETFGIWNASVGSQSARYVRARSLRRTTLHLEGLALR